MTPKETDPRSLIAWLAAALGAAGIGLLGWLYLDSRAENRLLEVGASIAEIDKSRLLVNLEAEQAVTGGLVADLTRARDLSRFRIALLTAPPARPGETFAVSPTVDAHGTVLWDPEAREGILDVTGVPPPAAGQEYRLWLIEADKSDPGTTHFVGAGILPFSAQNPAEAEHGADAASSHTRLRFRTDQTAGAIQAFSVTLQPANLPPDAGGPTVLHGQ